MLTAAQRRRVTKLLLRGAIAHGFGAELWTIARVALVIQEHCRVRFHRSHVARLLHELGFSCQKPEHRALSSATKHASRTGSAANGRE